MDITLRDFIQYYDDWNGYTVINDNNFNHCATVKTDRIFNGNYEKILDCEVISFGFYDGNLCVRIKC